ncbi:20847_t:CDS:2 [Entrophospora sp. SA101]|nr:20847_t:CDS:2 [Entrophospora sp. SA101]
MNSRQQLISQSTKILNSKLLPPLTLYRQILRIHQQLPTPLRLVGDDYVKSEFRQHKDITNPIHIVGFLTQWQNYLKVLESQISNKKHDQEDSNTNDINIISGSKSSKSDSDGDDNVNNIKYGKKFDDLEKFNDQQIGQLYELMKETKGALFKELEKKKRMFVEIAVTVATGATGEIGATGKLIAPSKNRTKKVEFAKIHGRNEASRQFNLEPTMIGRWIKACEKWDKSVKNKTKALGSGRRAFFPEAEEKLYKWIIEQRKQAFAVTYYNISNQMQKILNEPHFKFIYPEASGSFKYSKSWLLGFLRHKNLSL